MVCEPHLLVAAKDCSLEMWYQRLFEKLFALKEYCQYVDYRVLSRIFGRELQWIVY
jgi:hypothetical protein